MEIPLNTYAEDYVGLVHLVAESGVPVVVRDLPTRELVGVTLIVHEPDQPMLPIGVGRGVNRRLAAVEALALLGGVVRPELLTAASPGYTDVLVEADLISGAYGPRSGRAVAEVVRILKEDPGSRRAVVSVWQAEDLVFPGDRPCTISLQFMVRNDEYTLKPSLQLHVTMRSQDVWLGVPYDLFCFTQLQHTVARALGTDLGLYTHRVASLHVYLRDLDALDGMTRDVSSVSRQALAALPDGVHGVDEGGSYLQLQAVAQSLLAGVASEDVQAVNPWYIVELARLGMYLD